MVPGKRPAGSIRTVHAWRQANDQQACQRIAKRWYGPAEIARIVFCDVVKKPGEPWTQPAIAVENFSHPYAE
jgi:hypothetical protein